MTQRRKRLKNWMISLLVIAALSLTTACDEDNSLEGTEIVGDESLISDPDTTSTVIAYSQQLSGIQTNVAHLEKSGILGISQDPVFGKTTVNLLAQLQLSRTNPKFADGTKVDSVKLYMPYYSRTKIETDTTYILDSIYAMRPMKVEVFESNYFLRKMDPSTNFEDSQPYYSDQASLFESYLGAKLGEVEDFTPRALPIILTKGEGEDKEVVEELEPGFYLDLSTEFFEDKIINMEGGPELISNESFVEYFRGVYLKVTDINDAGSMFMFKTEASQIRIYYSSSPEDDDDDRLTGTLNLNFGGGTKVETIEKENSGYVEQQLNAQDSVHGSSRLLLQGGDIVSIIKLFGEDSNGSGIPDELELLRLDKPIVNEANLMLYVDQDALNAEMVEPERVIIFSVENGGVLNDYSMDQTASANTLGSKIIHLGRLHRDKNGKGEYYKIRITNYISELINNEEMEYFPLGIAVIPNVEVANATSVKEEENSPIKGIPSGTMFSPRGAVIHGTNSENEEKRLKMELYLTHY